MKCFEPMRGVKVWRNKKGALIFRLHYTADPTKAEPGWIEAQRKGMDEAFYRQEFEIDFGATAGAQLYHMRDDYTLEDEFDIPAHWTRYFALDPHPRKPFASLWVAVDPHGFKHVYRELWPSKIYGRPGRVPQDDNRVSIAHYVEAIAWLESRENPQNHGKREKIEDRVIDYAGRAFKASNLVDASEVNYQQLIEQAADNLSDKYAGFDLRFTDAKKDNKSVGIQIVNDMLLPVDVMNQQGEYEQRSKLRIMRQRCPELIWQLKHNRNAPQTSHQKESSDPELKALQVRNDLSDCLVYLCRNGMEYVEPRPEGEEDTWLPAYEGVSY